MEAILINKKRMIILVIILYSLLCKYDVKLQVDSFEKKINNFSIEEIQTQYGDELAEFYKVTSEDGYSKPLYSYLKWDEHKYMINIYSIKYDSDGSVLDSKDAYMYVTYKYSLGVEILDI